MSFPIDFASEPGVFALGGGLLDVDVRSPAAAARGLLPGVTGSGTELVGGFPGSFTNFSNSNYPLNSDIKPNTLYNIGDPLVQQATNLDLVRDMTLVQSQPYSTPFQGDGSTISDPLFSNQSRYPQGTWSQMQYAQEAMRTTPPPPVVAGSMLPPERTCLVCADEALGRHFGVLTCEACKSFFRRSVRTSAQYFCRYNRNCQVVKQSRNKCQYCRYQKCLRVGMQPDAVQEERNPANKGSSTPARSKADDSPVSSQQPSSVQVASPASSWSVGGVPAHTKDISTLLSETPVDASTSSSKVVTLPALLEAERAWPNDDLTKEPITTPADFSDIVEATKKQLNFAIEWAKMVPPFTSLTLEDQVVVLKSVWNELLTIQLAFRASPYESTLILGSGQLLYRDQGDPDIRRLVGRFIDEIVTPCKAMGLEMAELVSMKALVLFNPDCPKLQHPADVERLQEQCMELLSDYCHARFPDQKLRFSKILLRLSAVRSITTETRDYIIQHHQHSSVQVDSFVLEMLGVKPLEDEAPSASSS